MSSLSSCHPVEMFLVFFLPGNQLSALLRASARSMCIIIVVTPLSIYTVAMCCHAVATGGLLPQ